MDAIASFQGLATGINFRDLVESIVQAESRPLIQMEQTIADLAVETTAWEDFESRVQTLFDRSEDLSDGSLFDTYKTAVSGLATGETAPLTASSSSTADPGSYSVQVQQLATKEKVGSDVYSSRTAALGISGEFLIGGQSVSVSATDSLDDINSLLQSANAGTSRSKVSSAVVAAPSGGYRLVLTAEDTGAAGVDLADGSDGLLRSLGFVDTSVSLKNGTSNGAKSDMFISSGTAVGTLASLSSPASDTVTIGGFSVAIDLSTDSLDDIASAINTAAGLASSSVTASVIDVTDADGNARKQLDIDSTTSFTDASGILETLGVLEAGRSAVAQQVQGAAFTDSGAVTPASGSTLLTNMWGGGASQGIQAGDTLTIQGTQGDGTTFTKTYTVGASDTYQDLVDSLNSAVDGFGSGTRTATTAIDATGALTVTDDTGGNSQLALSIVANNEGGGTLDFGAFSTSTSGRLREIAAGLDAELEVDGAFYSRSSNSVSDVVSGVTLSLTEASSTVVSVDVSRDVDQIVSDVEAFVKSYNAVVEFVDSQFTGAGAEAGGENRPLSGDGILRTMRSQMRDALQTAISSTVTDVDNLSEIGITLNREGTYDVDNGVLKTAIETDAGSVQRFFGEYGAGSVSSLAYVAAGESTTSGAYAVDITTAATQATVASSGFSGTYVDDATADTMSVTDASTGSVYDVSLSNGMTTAQIVDALNTEFQTATTRELQTTSTLKSDAIGTDAGLTTTLDSVFDSGGTNVGMADGDVITISGSADDGSTFFREWTLTDVTTQTLADMRAEISSAIGSEVTVAFNNGQFTATSVDTGRKTFALSVSSDNAGGGSFSVGTFGVVEAGRGVARITASDASGEVQLVHSDYGSINGFTIGFTAGGADGSASLGLAATSYTGVDVAGTIGGQAATGSGSLLTADAGTAAAGLVMQYTGATTGAIGTATYSRGVASAMELVTDALLDIGGGSIQGILDGIDTQEQTIQGRILAFEDRLDLRAENLIKRFSALEEAMAQAQQQLSWLQAQLGTLQTPQG